MSLKTKVLVDRVMLLVAGVLLLPILLVAALPFLPVVLLVWPMALLAAI